MSAFIQGHVVGLPTNNEREREQRYSDKQFLHTHEAGVALLLKQAAVTAVLIGICMFAMVAVPALAFRWRHWFSWAMVLFIFSTLGTMLTMWLWRLRVWMKQTAERPIQSTGQAEAERRSAAREQRTVRVTVNHVKEDGHFQQEIKEIVATDEQLTALANGWFSGVPMSERQWTVNRKVFSPKEWDEFIESMLVREFAQYKNEKYPKLGFVPTETGSEFLKEYRSLPSPSRADGQ